MKQLGKIMESLTFGLGIIMCLIQMFRIEGDNKGFIYVVLLLIMTLCSLLLIQTWRQKGVS